MRREDGQIILECAADAAVSAEIVERRFGMGAETGQQDLNVTLLAQGVPEALQLAEVLLTDRAEQYADGIKVSKRGTLIILAAYAAEAAREGEDSEAAVVLHSLDRSRR